MSNQTIKIKQLDLVQLSGFITGIVGIQDESIYISGSGINYVSGNYVFITSGTNYVSGDVTINGGTNYFISGTNYVSGNNNISGGTNYISGTNNIFGGVNAISGGPNYISGSTNYISGNVASISGGTNILSGSVKAALSFWFDYVYTGLYQQEFFIADPIIFTGYKLGAIQSGLGPAHLSSGASGIPLPGPLSGNFYQRSTGNQISIITPFSFDSGVIYKELDGFNITISGGNRCGITINSGISGIQGFTACVLGNQSFVS